MVEHKSHVVGDFYDSYLDSIGTNYPYDVPRSVFRAIICDYMDHIMSEVLLKSKEVRLPGRMGYLSVIKSRPKNTSRAHLRVDFKATKELNKTVLHLNEHSDMYNYRFYWRKNEMIVRYKTLYELVLSRTNKRKLASIIKNKQADYIEI